MATKSAVFKFGGKLITNPNWTMGEEPAGVSLRFVLPQGKNETTCSDEMAEAFEAASHNDLAPLWIREAEALELANAGKTDVFVFDPFAGAAFQRLQAGHSALIGPRCLLSSLAEGLSVPDLPYPVYTTAMRNLIVTSTGFEKEVKSRLQQSIERMGGIYANVFHDGVTHLIADIVRSRKYEVAIEKDIPIMTSEWVHVSWERSKHGTIHATDKQFAKYSCPALKGLCITVSQMYKKDKDLIKKCIESHGGLYSGVLDMEKTCILVIPKAEGEKFDYARKWKIPCVKPEWVYDSISKGHCLPTLDFRVEKVKVSTPTRLEQSASSNLEEVSMCSTILHPAESNDTVTRRVDETVAGNNSTMLSPRPRTNDSGPSSIPALLAKLDLQRVKKAGPFLEGCRVFVSGFTDAQETQLSRVLQPAEAIKHNQLTSTVTHMIVGRREPSHWQILQQQGIHPYKVTLQWVVESMLMGQPLPEEDFLYNDTKPILPEPRPNDEELFTQFESDILNQYQGGGSTPKAAVVAPNDDQTNPTIQAPHDETADKTGIDEPSCTQVERFLQDKKLALVGFDESTESELSDWVGEAGGDLVFTDFVGVLDYLIVPVQGAQCNFQAKVVVTSLWLEECLDLGQIVHPMQYWHKPLVPLPNFEQPCRAVVIGVTNYAGRERVFIAKLAETLGMMAQEIFAKRDKGEAKKSSHLICSSPEGAKYEAAVKWGLPVISKDWLLACYFQREWVSEKTFLIGNATSYTAGKAEVDNETLERMRDAPPIEGTTTPGGLEPSRPDPEDTITFKTPVQRPNEVSNRLHLETPGDSLDLEKLRPKPMVLDFTPSPAPTTSRWAADSQPSPSQISLKRKREDTSPQNLPFFLDGVKTPQTPYGAFLNSNPSPKTRKIWKRQVNEMARYRMTDSEKENLRQEHEELKGKVAEIVKANAPRALNGSHEAEIARADHEKSKDLLKSKGIPVLGDNGKTFEELMDAKLANSGLHWNTREGRGKLGKEDQSNASRSSCLKEATVYVARKHEALQDEIHTIVQSLGGSVTHQYESQIVTHMVFSGKANELTKEFRVAKKDGKFVVSPDWVFMCRNESRRIDEDTFPHNFNPKKSLNLTLSTVQSTRRPSAKRNKAQDSKLEEPISPPPDNVSRAEDDIASHLAKIDEILDASSNEKETPRRSTRISLTSDNHHSDLEPMETTDGGTIGKRGQSDSDSQVVQWVDPKEDDEREKLKAHLDMETQAMGAPADKSAGREEYDENDPTFVSMDMPENLTELMGDQNSDGNASMNVPKVFMMSCLSDKARAKFVTFLEKHHVKFSSTSNCDPDATHIIAPKLTRSEKMLGSIASGKWILHDSYIEACIQADRLLEESPFEWGNPSSQVLKAGSPLERSLALAGYRWRTKLARERRRGAYTGIKAILHTSKTRSESFQRLLALGDGEVLSILPPYSAPQGATHCFAEMTRMEGVSVDYRSLAKHGVAMVGPLFINEFLMSEHPPNVEDHLVEPFKPYWDKLKA